MQGKKCHLSNILYNVWILLLQKAYSNSTSGWLGYFRFPGLYQLDEEMINNGVQCDFRFTILPNPWPILRLKKLDQVDFFQEFTILPVFPSVTFYFPLYIQDIRRNLQFFITSG